MRIHHIIHVTPGRCALYTAAGRHFELAGEYRRPGGDPSALVAWLGAHGRGRPVGVLIDVLEEHFTRIVIPRLGARDRKVMMARRLARQYPRSPYRAARLMARTPGEPASDNVMLTAITQPAHLDTLMSALREARIPVCGIWSPALLSNGIIQRSGLTGKAIMVVTQNSDGSLRHTFFRNNELAGSRLLRRSLAATPDDGHWLRQQINESIRYFEPSFIVGPDNVVDILLLDPGARLTEGEGLRLQVVDGAALRRQVGIDTPLRDDESERLYVELLGRLPPRTNLAPAIDLGHRNTQRASGMARAACFVLSAVLLVAAMQNIGVRLGLRQELVATRQSVSELQALIGDTASPDEQGIDPLEMRRAVLSHETLLRHASDPARLLGVVSAALDGQPAITLEHVAWGSAIDGAAAQGSDGTATADDTVDGNGETGPPATATDARMRLVVRARVEPFDGNYPAAFAAVERFLGALRAQPQVAAARPLELPLDVDADKALTGEWSPANAEPKAVFSVEVTLGNTDEQA